MAETSRFWTTNGTGDGPSGGYTQQQFYDFLRRVFLKDDEATQGILKNVLNQLAVTSPSATNIDVATGAAMVHGFYYENTAVLNLSFSAPAATTGGRVILTANWAAQTVRASVLLNTSGVTSPPTMTQSAGTTWQISLATFQTDSAGNVSSLVLSTDYAAYGTNITQEMLTSGIVDTQHLVADAVDGTKIADDSIDSEHYVDGSIDTAHIANEAVTAAKIDNRARRFFVPVLYTSNVTDGIDGVVDSGVSGRSYTRLTDNKIIMSVGHFSVPSDYASGLSVKAVVESQAAGNARLQMNISHASAGEAGNIHTASFAEQDVALSTDIVAEVASVSLPSVTITDHITEVRFQRKGNHANDTIGASVRFYGWIVEYTADS
jgi:hypothetical protein